MTRSNDEGKFLKSRPVDRELAGKAVERVSGTLDLVTMQVAVEHGQIYPTLGVSKPKFVDDQNVLPSMMTLKVTSPQCSSDHTLGTCVVSSHRR
jgi:hypothetical protein